MIAMTPTLDAELGRLNAAVNATVIGYGDAEVRREVVGKVAFASAAPASTWRTG